MHYIIRNLVNIWKRNFLKIVSDILLSCRRRGTVSDQLARLRAALLPQEHAFADRVGTKIAVAFEIVVHTIALVVSTLALYIPT